MAKRIEAFHRRQRDHGFRLALPDGSLLEEVVQPLDSAGLYVPGGAGAYSVVGADGTRSPRVSPGCAARRRDAAARPRAERGCGRGAGAGRARGRRPARGWGTGDRRARVRTRSIRPVAKIVGPGNAYVTAAKRRVRGTVEIDGEAGPARSSSSPTTPPDAGWVPRISSPRRSTAAEPRPSCWSLLHRRWRGTSPGSCGTASAPSPTSPPRGGHCGETALSCSSAISTRVWLRSTRWRASTSR